MSRRLRNIRGELEFRLVASVMSQVDVLAVKTEDQFHDLNEGTKKLVDAMLRRADLEEVLRLQTNEIIQRHDNSDALAVANKNEIIDAIGRIPERLRPTKTSHTDLEDPEAVQNKLLAHLKFSTMLNRGDDINDPFSQTYEWIMNPTMPGAGTRPRTGFVEWLENGEGLYWVSGRAGAGKSTLMKFLAENDRTRELLQLWAADSPLLILSFYFSAQGSALQRSQLGLLRSLLFQTVDQFPALATVVFPEMFDCFPDWAEFPTFSQCKRAIRRLVKQQAVKICLLIDGLDEYETNENSQDEIVELFKP